MTTTTTIPDLTGTRVLLGISGGIAAYKSADLARRLVEANAQVRIAMTASAQDFITPLTLQALTGNPVHTDLLDTGAEAAMGHIELARWPDLILIAPATANTIARLACGIADDLLTTLCLATDRPIMLAPAMNRLMWANEATRSNVSTLEARGMVIVGPDSGDQACGETGAGRMLEPTEIRSAVSSLLSESDESILSGVSVMVTAGPTREAIDPVRYLSNRSSGKMGFAVAEAARELGAEVTLVTGPVHLHSPANINRINVTTAQEMMDEVLASISEHHIFIGVAAVADYRVETMANQKIKKSDETLSLTLVRNPDILATVAQRVDRPFCVGFAAETEDVAQYARDKMKRKNLDMIAANHVAQKHNAVFASDTNALDVFWKNNGYHKIPTAGKKQVATTLMTLIAKRFLELNNQ